MVVAVVVLGVAVVVLLALVGTISTRRRAAEERATELDARVEALEADLAEATGRAAAAEAEAEGTRTELAATTVRATRAEQRADEADRRGRDLEDRLGAREAELADLTAREAELATEVAAAAQRVDELTTELDEGRARVDELTTELDEGRARVDELTTELDEGRARVEELTTELAGQRADVERLEVELAAAARFDAAGWWQLETRRADRLWHDRVALPGWPEPMVAPEASRDEHLREAVRVFTETSREESGVVIDLVWEVGTDLPPDLCVGVLRLAEELVAVARAADGGELAVRRAGDEVEVRLTTEPPVPPPTDLASSLARFGWRAADDADAIVITIPLPD